MRNPSDQFRAARQNYENQEDPRFAAEEAWDAYQEWAEDQPDEDLERDISAYSQATMAWLRRKDWTDQPEEMKKSGLWQDFREWQFENVFAGRE